MPRHPRPVFKDTQLFGWDSEPAVERASTSFHASEFTTPRRPVRSHRRGMARLALACAALIAAGAMGLLHLVPVLHRFMG